MEDGGGGALEMVSAALFKVATRVNFEGMASLGHTSAWYLGEVGTLLPTAKEQERYYKPAGMKQVFPVIYMASPRFNVYIVVLSDTRKQIIQQRSNETYRIL